MKKHLFFTLLALLGLISSEVSGQTTVHTFTYGGLTRSYRVYLPVNFNSNTSLPLILNLHGLNSNAQQQELYTSMDNLADTARCVIVYPDGINAQWNIVVGCTGTSSPCTGVDDVGFISALIDTIHKNYNIDLGKVYSCGMSDGAYMTFRLACELSCRIAAGCAVAGLLQEAYPLYPQCNPTRKVPMIQIHGTADSVVHYSNSAPYASVASTVTRWKAIDVCPSNPVVTNLPDINTTDGCTATENWYGLCGDSTLLIQYTINGGGHTWPEAFPDASLGNTNEDMNANSVMWNFFKHYSLPADLAFTGLSASYCSSASAVTLTGVPSGGTFSGSGISGSQFSPSTAGAGSHVISYSITAHGCTYTSTQTVTVTSGSSASISGLNASYCSNASAVTLSGSPSGGTFSGMGISGSQFNPQTAGVGGPYQITYSGNSGGCSFSTTQSVTVNAVPTASFSGLASTYCLSQNPGAITLTGTPSGGTFTGTGVSGSTFTPATAGAGTHTITYTVTVAGCSNTSTHSTTVVANANPSISGLNAHYCKNAGTVTLTGSPSGGTFSGTGVSGSQFNPQSAGVGGPYQITYSGNISGCAFSASHSVTVDSVPNASYTGLASAYCLSQNPGTITLTGTPAGGVFSGTGVSGNTFTPATAGAGSFAITYTVTLGNCSDTSSHSTTIVASSNATLSGLNTHYCADAQAVTITATPAGGTFSGTGISGNQFNPQTAGPGGPYVISYSGTLAGCTFSGSQSVYVDSVPVLSISGLDTAYCLNPNPGTITLSGTPTGGVFSGPGITGNQFSPATAGTGYDTINYSYTDNNNCTGNKQAYVKVKTCGPNGIDEHSLFEEFSVYPNPAGDILNVVFKLKEITTLKLVLYDLAGKNILSMNLGYKIAGNASLNTAGIPQGLYYLKLESENNRSVRKVAIAR